MLVADTPLDRLIAFVNTIDLEGQRDAIGTPDELAAWLRERGELGSAASVSREEHARAIQLREGLRALGRENNNERADPLELRAMDEATAALPLTASLASRSVWELRPTGGGGDAFLARLVATTVRAMATGEWSRVKACQNDICRWLFIDRSRNRSHTWCSMAICGSRAKSRAYRARQRKSA